MKSKLILLLLLTSCFERSTPSDVSYSTPEMRAEKRQESLRLKAEQERLRLELIKQKQIAFAKAKKDEWVRITLSAKESYQDIAKIISRKCADCHNENKRLPLYGRIFRRINPVYKHQKDGLAAIDFSQIFPLKTSEGYKPKSLETEVNTSVQIAYLKAIKNSVIERSMPIRSYTFVYRSRKLYNSDEEAIINWIDPIIENINNYKKVYEVNLDDGSNAFKVAQIFEAKCIRCHGNGKDKGGFGDIEKLQELSKTKYINPENPEESKIYKEVLSGNMPTNESERLGPEELNYVLEWIKEVKSSN